MNQQYNQQAGLVTHYLEVFLSLLTTPLGALMFLVALAMIVAAGAMPRSKWFFVLGAVYFATLPLIDVRFKYQALAFPLEQFRQFARPIIYFFTALLLLPLLTSNKGWRRKLIGWPLALFWFFELTICLRLIAFGSTFEGEGILRGVLSLGTYILLILTVGLAVSRWLQTFEDFYKLVWVLSAVGGLVVLGTVYQLAINRQPIVWNNRLTGVTSNPQFLGIIIAYTLPFTCHLLTRSGGMKVIRPLLLLQVAFTIVMLIWTGSRTGALSTGLALLVAFHRRIGRFAIAGAIIGAVVLALMPYFEGSQQIASRLLSTQDTRAQVWANLIYNIKEHFWLGAARDSFETQESSYLSILGQFGIFGSLPFIAAAAALVVQIIQLRQLRRYLGSEAPVVDIICGVWTAVAVTGLFESLMVGVVTFPIYMIYLFSAATTFLLDWCRATAEAEAIRQQYPDDPLLAAA